MIFHETKIPGAFLIEPEPHADARGFEVREVAVRDVQTAALVAYANIEERKFPKE